ISSALRSFRSMSGSYRAVSPGGNRNSAEWGEKNSSGLAARLQLALDVSDRLVEHGHNRIGLFDRQNQRRRQREDVRHISENHAEPLPPNLHFPADPSERIERLARPLVLHQLDPRQQPDTADVPYDRVTIQLFQSLQEMDPDLPSIFG